MDTTRRVFLRNLALVGVATAAVPALVLGRSEPAVATSATEVSAGAALEHATFAKLVGEQFEVSGDAGVLALTLAGVSRYDRGPAVENFSVHFSPTTKAPRQGTYRFAHPQLGEFDLFVVPERTAAGEGCVAVFNRLV